ncbi:MAG: hypothetical protein RIG68_03055 [Imperialibacter sp.]|uniref:hypothetical protein n=1 Tax=Imperialibacter sp. TaxID=2038411 RepID=UPI0032EAA58C
MDSKAKAWLVIIGIIILAIFINYLGNNPDKPKEKKQYVTEYEAKVVAETQVKELLKAPSTAKFSGVKDTKIEAIAGGGYKVSGYVDSQNSFGAMLRSKYTCDVFVDKETGDIMYKNLKID